MIKIEENELAVIGDSNGKFVIYTGLEVYEEDKNAHIIEKLELNNGVLKIKAKRIKSIFLDYCLPENEGYIEFEGEKLRFHEVLKMLKYPESAIVYGTKKHFFKPNVKFKSIENGSHILKEEYYQTKEILTTNFLIINTK